MTSSLVGSEMCIRDRFSAVLLSEPAPVLNKISTYCSVISAQPAGSKAVSYTHLTLPTICSV
eukprot:1053662-Prorocentrum_lima.AAC.1